MEVFPESPQTRRPGLLCIMFQIAAFAEALWTPVDCGEYSTDKGGSIKQGPPA